MKFAKLVVAFVVTTGLAGCTTTPPTLKNGETIVHLHAQIGDQILARRLDAQRSENLTYFKVLPGARTMELGIITKGHQENQHRCVATVVYNNFLPDEHYTLNQSSSGREVKVELLDSEGNTLAQTDKVACL